MATDRLKIYNGALLICAERELASLSENQASRHMLDLVWNDGGARYCLEQGQWHFAMRTARLSNNTSIEPDFGYRKIFDKPTDWVATSGVFQDEYLTTPLTRYADEVAYWFCDFEEIFVKYVSDDTAFGMDLSRWPSSFIDYVKAYFAGRIIRKLPGGADRVADLTHPKTGLVAQTLLIAKNKAAMAQPTTFPTRGTWTAARHRGATGRRDGGNTNQLIG